MIFQQIYGREHWSLAEPLHYIGFLYYLLEDYTNAIKNFEISIKIQNNFDSIKKQ